MYFRRIKSESILESFYTTKRQKNIACFSVDENLSPGNAAFEAIDCFYSFALRQEVRPTLTEEDNKYGTQKRELDELKRNYVQEKNFIVIEMSV